MRKSIFKWFKKIIKIHYVNKAIYALLKQFFKAFICCFNKEIYLYLILCSTRASGACTTGAAGSTGWGPGGSRWDPFYSCFSYWSHWKHLHELNDINICCSYYLIFVSWFQRLCLPLTSVSFLKKKGRVGNLSWSGTTMPQARTAFASGTEAAAGTRTASTHMSNVWRLVENQVLLCFIILVKHEAVKYRQR